MAFLLRFDFSLPHTYRHSLIVAIPVWILVKAAAFWIVDVNRRGWRYVSTSDLARLLIANVTGSAVSAALLAFIVTQPLPRSISPLDLILCFLGTAGLRLVARSVADLARSDRTKSNQKRTLIYGAGYAGITLLREIHNNPNLPYKVVGFIDDSPEKHGLFIGGVPVLGDGASAKEVATKKSIQAILIAIPSATGNQMTRILEVCNAVGAEFKTVPGLGEVIEGRGLEGQIREVAVEDLLGRVTVSLDEAKLRQTLGGKMVLVTGAAGSIGSELCRQIARFGPAGIVGFEIAESPLFEIDREMQKKFPAIPFYPEIGSIQNRARIEEVLAQYNPSVIYHAAAYKHVPLMETHIFEAIENNVFGTHNLASAAEKYDVSEFVMISSDKAVRPTNVMGASKRVAELVLREFGHAKTKFIAVRFGNVLGSNGSVIPIFKKQIANGGPVSVTHPEMRRFFMTIPEACQLVLQAGAIGKHGQVCVLDMGQPVKIVDLARNLILLSGLRPEEDIKIEFTGIRPGEKLYEELSTSLEETCETEHEKIRIFIGSESYSDKVHAWLASLEDICEARDVSRLVLALKEIVVDYSPSAHLLKRALRSQREDRVESLHVR